MEYVFTYYVLHGLSLLSHGLRTMNYGLIAHGYTILATLLNSNVTPNKSPQLEDLGSFSGEGVPRSDQTFHCQGEHSEDEHNESGSHLLEPKIDSKPHTDQSEG